MKTQDILIAHPKTTEQITVLKAFLQALKIKFEIATEERYDPNFVSKIEKSKQEYRNREFISIEKNELKSFLGLE